MMNKKNLFKTLVFIILLLSLILVSGQILQPYKKLANEYKTLPSHSIDVAHFGTSHFANGTNPAALWDEYGISSYVIHSNAQTIPFTYLYIKEFISYQTPKVIVVDIYTLLQVHDGYGLIKSPGYLKENGMKTAWCKEKWSLLSNHVPPDFLAMQIFPFVEYHSRWKELNENDLKIYKSEIEKIDVVTNFKFNAKTNNIPNFQTKDTAPLESIDEEYLIKIIHLLKEHDIELLFVQFPCVYREGIAATDWLEKLNTAKDILNDHQIPYIDYNLISSEITFDYTRDLMDFDHMNIGGSRKVMSHLGNYIKENYTLQDHRGDKKYEIWDIAKNRYQEVLNSSQFKKFQENVMIQTAKK